MFISCLVTSSKVGNRLRCTPLAPLSAHVLRPVLKLLCVVQDLATRAGTIEDKLANGAVGGKVFSEKTTYFFFETPVDRYGNNRQIYEHPVADAELLRLLNQRLAYYLDYRIKDLQDGTVMTFVKAFLMRGKFYMTMSTAEGRVRYTYMHMPRPRAVHVHSPHHRTVCRMSCASIPPALFFLPPLCACMCVCVCVCVFVCVCGCVGGGGGVLTSHVHTVCCDTRSYRLDHKDETGRDIYKNCSEVELRQIADFDHHW